MNQEFPLENKLQGILKKDFGAVRAKSIFADYIQARDCLASDILRYIVAAEPNLTDHGVDHIRNVLQNIELLLKDKVRSLGGAELYILMVSTLFHDVGNLFGRKNHQKRIGDIYEHVRHSQARFSQEKSLVLRIAGAHTGEARDGSNDTLYDLDDTDNLHDQQVRSRALAAILRLADELAEGQQRTSDYIIKAHGFASESSIFHQYAQATIVHPDRGNERIALTYNLRLKTKDQRLANADKVTFLKFLKFIYGRITKLDAERKYTKHYTSLLEPFKKTTVRFNFHVDSMLSNLDLGDLTLSDKIVPGGNQIEMTELFPKCDPDRVWRELCKIRVLPSKLNIE